MGDAPGAVLVVSAHADRSARVAGPLRACGHQVEVIATEAAALDRAGAGGLDVIVFDIQSGGGNPFQTLRRLLATGTPPPPVLIMAPADAVERVGRGLEMGAVDSLLEPLEPALLTARIGLVLDRARLQAQVQQDVSDRQRIAAALASSERYERDVQIGRQIQASFLPEALPRAPGWEIAARFQPARQVAGDWYDAFPLTHGRIGLVIADVCDKGVGAALFMALMRSLIRAYAQQNYALRWLDAVASDDLTAPRASAPGQRRRMPPSVGVTALKNAVELTNNYIAKTHANTGMFATMFFGMLDTATGRLSYVNGGHEAPVILSAQGQITARLGATGLPIGVMPDGDFGIEQVDLAPGDILVSYTDGVPEARDPDRAFYTEKRLLALLERPATSAEALLDRVLDTVSAHIADADQFDDITLLAVRRTMETATQGS
jgi:sigma-B regulation protein RsbU (phosphoserine phosphatase)